MLGRGILILFAVMVALILPIPGSTGSPDTPITSLFRKADSLLNLPNPTDIDNKNSLKGFEEVITTIENNPGAGADTLLFLSYRNKGILMDIDANYPAARNAYCRALQLQQFRNQPADSLIVMTYINVGATYYNLNNFDSASYFLLKAESLMSRFPDLEYKIRLYNTLGVLYHDNGNYLQCKNYFSQALEIIKGREPFDTISAISVEINIATSLSRLGQYQESLTHYEKMLPYKLFSSYIYMNMGKANSSLGNYQKALACFRKVKVEQIPWVFNEIGFAHLQLNNPDSTRHYLDKVQQPSYYERLSLADRGINKFYKSELLLSNRKYLEALDTLQGAIILFTGNFTDQNIYSNPSGFTGSFAYYRLFTALSKKAILFDLLFKQSRKNEYLLASLDTYNSALTLLAYIEKSYDTDDAKILLKKKSRDVYQGAFLVCLELSRLFPDGKYLEQAFTINERNKASVMVASLQERSFESANGTKQSLLQEERNIKFNIARLAVQSDQAMNREQLDAIASEKARYEIELARLRKTLEQNGQFYKLKYDERYPTIKELQNALDRNQALISFYTTDSVLHAFVITEASFNYKQIGSFPFITKGINEWLNILKSAQSGRKFNAGNTGTSLYQCLIEPLQQFMSGVEEWIVVPDGVLYFLPFESLPRPSDSKYLLETTAVSYQFSSRFIIDDFSRAKHDIANHNLLAFAPFAKQGGDFGRATMEQLPASGDEIANVEGSKFVDSQATKGRFLKEINKYPIVHLATHAVADSNSSSTFIAFYPQKKLISEDCLFLDELYGLNMDSTKLVIISACETGNGELVNSEGVISLARAFVYAGCPSTVSSLWKADDKATAAILKQFHSYLQEGYSKSKALQLAKLDYIASNALYKSPAYWSHLVLMGKSDPVYEKKRWDWWIGLFAVASLSLVFLVIWKGKKKSTFSMNVG